MRRHCKCGGKLVKSYDCRTFFTMRCILCGTRYTQHKRLPANYKDVETARLKARYEELKLKVSLARVGVPTSLASM